MIVHIKEFLQARQGATAIEYGLIAALVAVALITVLNTMGNSLKNNFSKVGSSVQSR